MRILLAILMILSLGACASVGGTGSAGGAGDSELSNSLRAIPFRPYLATERLPGSPDEPIRYYGLQFKQSF